MGAYLSTPVTDKESFEGSDGNISFGGSAMQGWRRTMEDAHIATLNLEHDISLFGVFDGHGGSEVAKFCSKYMASEILQLSEVKNGGDLGQALVKLFHRMDDMLRSEDHSHELAEFKGKRSDDEESDGEAEGGSGQGVSPSDAIDLLKKFIAMKRQGGEGGSGANGGGGEGDAAVLDQNDFSIIEDDIQEDTLPEHSIQAGCTAVVALLKDRKHLYIANAGDSRAILCRRGTAVALSEDHKPAQERERTRIVAAGGFLSEIGGVCRVNGNLNLSRAIGDLKYKQNDTLPAADQIITAEPDICHIELTDEDQFFVLACDGVWDVMENQEVCDFVGQRLARGQSPKEVACELLDACLASNPRDAKGIGCDNMTAQIVVLRPQGHNHGG